MCVHVLTSSSYKDMNHTGLEPTHMILFYVNYLFTGPISKYSHIWRYWDLRLQYINFERKQFCPHYVVFQTKRENIDSWLSSDKENKIFQTKPGSRDSYF